MIIIYLISRKRDGKSYVGQTAGTLKSRLAQHIRCDENGIGAAIRRAGRKAFIAVELETCDTREEANRLERLHIGLLHTLSPNGYNQKPSGDGRTPSRRLRKRIPKAPRREQSFYAIDDLDFMKARQDYFDAMSIAEE